MPYPRLLRAFSLVALIAVARVAPAQEAPPASEPASSAAQKAPAAPPTPAEEKIDEAIKLLRALPAVTADLEMKVDMLGQVFTLSGQYLKDKGSKAKLLLTLSGLGDAKGRMLQVCDGKLFFDYREVLDSKSCDKLEIAPILKRLESPDCDPALRDLFMNRIGFAGPEALLVGLRSAIGFNQIEDGTLEDKPVWVIRGLWKDRTMLTGPNQQPFQSIGPLPAYVPAVAELFVGKQDGWPYRVVLSGKPPLGPLKSPQAIREGRPEGPKMPVAKEKPSRLVLVYSKVNFDPKLSPADFAFQPPPNVPVRDETASMTAFLDQRLADRAASKKEEAGKLGEPVLEKPLVVPKPPGDAAPPPGP